MEDRRPAERKPTAVSEEPWLFAYRPASTTEPDDDRPSGKWLLFVAGRDLDECWQKIELATISGQLGYAAKTATRTNHSPGRPDKFVICVYVQGNGERKKVASALKGLGFSNLRFSATIGRG